MSYLLERVENVDEPLPVLVVSKQILMAVKDTLYTLCVNTFFLRNITGSDVRL